MRQHKDIKYLNYIKYDGKFYFNLNDFLQMILTERFDFHFNDLKKEKELLQLKQKAEIYSLRDVRCLYYLGPEGIREGKLDIEKNDIKYIYLEYGPLIEDVVLDVCPERENDSFVMIDKILHFINHIENDGPYHSHLEENIDIGSKAVPVKKINLKQISKDKYWEFHLY